MAVATLAAVTSPITSDDAWAINTVQSFGPYAAADVTGGVTKPLFVMPEGGDIVGIYLSIQTAFTNTGIFKFYAAASGTALGSGSLLTDDVTGTDVTTLTSKSVPILAAGAKLAAGSIVGFVASGVLASGTGFTVTIVTRKGGYITNDAGNKSYVQGLHPSQPSQYAM